MIVMGRVVAPFGIHGWLKLVPLGDDPLTWRKMPQWWFGRNPDSQRPEDWRVCVPRGLRMQGKTVVLAIEGVEDRTAAETLDGFFLAAPREALPPTAKDEFYWTDLIGLEVLGSAGVALGRVTGLVETGAHDVLEVSDGETERLIPFVETYVEEVDLAVGVMRVAWEADW